MSGTIENIDNFIVGTSGLLQRITSQLDVNGGVIAHIVDRIDNVYNNYLMATLEILNDYFLFCGKRQSRGFHDRKRMFVVKFKQIIDRENFLSDLEVIKARIMQMEISDVHRMEMNKIGHPGCAGPRSENLFSCENCGIKMDVSPAMSHVICKRCGINEELKGMIFEDEQFFQQEGQRAKHGNYDPVKHCRSWIDKIQARESADIPVYVINMIRRKAKNNRLTDLRSLSCETIRKYLHKSRYSKFNEHIPLIRKIITGVAPPQFSDLERRRIIIYFGKIVVLNAKIKPNSKTNTTYHPYFIMKIIEQIVGDVARRKKIIACIHMQALETLIDHDKDWKKICEYIPEFTYIPTDRNNYADVW